MLKVLFDTTEKLVTIKKNNEKENNDVSRFVDTGIVIPLSNKEDSEENYLVNQSENQGETPTTTLIEKCSTEKKIKQNSDSISSSKEIDKNKGSLQIRKEMLQVNRRMYSKPIETKVMSVLVDLCH